VQNAVDYVMQALEAMAHAHAAGIVHRDLKPENLFVALTSDGREVIRVLDFGIAKLSQANRGLDAARLTAERSAIGSPHYMAPEQVRDSSQIDHRADLWALGTILYELVTGVEAFRGESVGDIFASVLHTAPTPMCALRPDVPAELDAVVARCLTREIDGRFVSVAELAYALAPLASREGSALAERIEQTLTRPQRLSDPRLSDPVIGAADSGPISVGKMRGRFSSVPAASTSSPPERLSFGSLVAHSDRPRISEPGPVSAKVIPPVAHEGRRSGRWVLPVLAVLLIGTVCALVFVRAHARKNPAALAPVSAGTAPVAPPPTASLAPVSSPVSQAVSQAPPVSLSSAAASAAPSDAAPAPTGRRSKRPSAHPAAPAPKLDALSSPHLPGVLGSPD
jgi:serine/threonine-protein kinase